MKEKEKRTNAIIVKHHSCTSIIKIDTSKYFINESVCLCCPWPSLFEYTSFLKTFCLIMSFSFAILLGLISTSAGSCHYSEDVLHEATNDLICGNIMLDEFIAIHYDMACLFQNCEGAVVVRFNTLRHCMRVIVELNMVQDVSFHARMGRFVELIARQSRGNWGTKHWGYKIRSTSKVIQFADDIHSFVLQTDDGYYVYKLKHVLYVIFVQFRSRLIDLDIDNYRSSEIRQRMDQIYEAMNAATPGTQSHVRLKNLYSAICCHFVHRIKMNGALTAEQHQRMIDFIADHGALGACQTFIAVLQRRDHSFFSSCCNY